VFPFEVDESQLIGEAAARRSRDADAIMALRANLDHVKKHSVDLVRERSVWALSLVENGEVVRPLVEKMDDPDWRVRAYAAWALAEVEDPRAMESLVRGAQDDHWRVRMHALGALAATPTQDNRREHVLIQGLEDEVWQVRAVAVESLADLGTPEATAALRGVARDEHKLVRDLARDALEDLRKRER
jgi:serine/threonine-protein kinase